MFDWLLFQGKNTFQLCKWLAGLCKIASIEYCCHPLTAVFTLPRLLVNPSRWCDLEINFELFAFQISDILSEQVEPLLKHYRYILQLILELLHRWACTHSGFSKEEESRYEICTRFIDCTKIGIVCPGGHVSCQYAAFSGHQRMNFLKYQTISAPDGFTFSMYGLVKGSATILRYLVKVDGKTLF